MKRTDAEIDAQLKAIIERPVIYESDVARLVNIIAQLRQERDEEIAKCERVNSFLRWLLGENNEIR